MEENPTAEALKAAAIMAGIDNPGDFAVYAINWPEPNREIYALAKMISKFQPELIDGNFDERTAKEFHTLAGHNDFYGKSATGGLATYRKFIRDWRG